MDLTYSIAKKSVLKKKWEGLWEGLSVFLIGWVADRWPVLLFLRMVALAIRAPSHSSKKYRLRLKSQRSHAIRRAVKEGTRFFAAVATNPRNGVARFPSLVPGSVFPIPTVFSIPVFSEFVVVAQEASVRPLCFDSPCSFQKGVVDARIKEAVDRINAEKFVPAQPPRKR